MNSQQFADETLARYRELAPLPGEERIAIMVADFWFTPLSHDVKYEETLRLISMEMADD